LPLSKWSYVDATDQTFYPSIRLNTAVASSSCQCQLPVARGTAR
jgi:hypothetical protein